MNDNDRADDDMAESCCRFYESDMVKRFFGKSFHPGGIELSLHLGKELGLKEGDRVLDVACGTGATAIALARRFGCGVLGIDLSEENVGIARTLAVKEQMDDRVRFEVMDASSSGELSGYDVVICECALCTFPDKEDILVQMGAALNEGGRIGITDVLLERELPPSLKGLLGHVLCISGALSKDGYVELLESAGFTEVVFEDHSDPVLRMADRIEAALPLIDLITSSCGCDLEKEFGISKEEAVAMASDGVEMVRSGGIGYGMFTGVKTK